MSSSSSSSSSSGGVWRQYPLVPAPRMRVGSTKNIPKSGCRPGLLIVVGLGVFLTVATLLLTRVSNGSPSFIVHRHQQERAGQQEQEGQQESHPDESPSMAALIETLFKLGRRNSSALLHLLETTDPFSVSTAPADFACPVSSQRIDWVSLVNDTNAARFRRQEPGAFIFYQHLRKAGGTSFCELCRANLPRHQVPPYYCMPDQKGSLSTPPWSDAKVLTEAMDSKGFKVAANEWDVWLDVHRDIPGAVLATTFRHPIDRWYSQYRFEHLEHRDNSKEGDPRLSFKEWYRRMQGWTMDRNYYCTTFWGLPDTSVPRNANSDFYWTYHKFSRMPLDWAFFSRSLLNIRSFHLLLVTEYLDFSGPMIQKTLGWASPPKQVLPHEVQAPRQQKKNVPARSLMPIDDYREIAAENVVDILLFDVVRRIWLERFTCAEGS